MKLDAKQAPSTLADEGFQPHIKLNGLCLVVVKAATALNLERDRPAGQLVKQQQVHAVIIGDWFEGRGSRGRRCLTSFKDVGDQIPTDTRQLFLARGCQMGLGETPGPYFAIKFLRKIFTVCRIYFPANSEKFPVNAPKFPVLNPLQHDHIPQKWRIPGEF